MDANLAAAEIVAAAVRAEREAALFYSMLADMVGEPEVAERMRSLAADEEGHARDLVDLHVALTGRAPQSMAVPAPEGDLNLLDFGARTLRELLEHVLASEQRAASTYEYQAREAEDGSQERIWRMLAETERGHAQYLELQLARLEG